MNKSTPSMNTVWLFVEKVLFLIISFLVTLAIARYLMPEMFGKLSFLVSIVSLLAPISALGLNSLVTRELIQRTSDAATIIGSAIFMRLMAGLVVSAVVYFTSGFWLPTSVDGFLLAILVFASSLSAALIIDFWLQANEINRYGVLIRLLVLLMFGLIRVGAIWVSASFETFIYITCMEFLALAFLYLFTYIYLQHTLPRFRFSWHECYSLLHQSRWLFFSGLAAVLYLKIDQVMLGVMVNDREVGIYAVAAKFSDVWYFIPAALVTAFFPQLVEKSYSATPTYGKDLQKINDLLFSLSLFVAIFVTFSADWFIPILFGYDYTDSIPVLLIHIWAAIFVFMRSLLSKWLIVENLMAISLLSQLLGAVANIVLNLLLIPEFGAVGAAYATVLSYFSAGYLVLFLHRSLWPMALITSKSLMLPCRLLMHGRKIYQD